MKVTLETAMASLISNKRRVSALKSLGVVTVRDALEYFPFRVTPAVAIGSIRDARVGSMVAFPAVVRRFSVYPMQRGGHRAVVTVSDDEVPGVRYPGVATLVFFSYKKHYIDWLALRLAEGMHVVVSGEPREYNDSLEFTHPDVLVIEPRDPQGVPIPMEQGFRADAPDFATALDCVARPQPVYHASSRISSEHVHDAILGALQMLAASASDGGAPDGGVNGGANGADATANGTDTAATAAAAAPQEKNPLAPAGPVSLDVQALVSVIPDIIPEGLRADRGFMHRAEAFAAMHNPETVDDFSHALATLRYEEALVSQVSLLQERANARESSAYVCLPPAEHPEHSLENRFIDSLPFSLTKGQREVIDTIDADMAQKWPMQRLLQGEVGSGKTVVALAAMLNAIGSGYQAVLVAPTQVLAEQHYESAQRMLATVPGAKDVPVVLLTGGMKLAQRRRVLATAASGVPCLIVATHAAFSKSFQAPRLALVVIDEQHRFGVEQRQALVNGDGPTPHMLVMTATPIPRTAAMTWFGNLDISWLTELPGGRKPITSVVVNEADNHTMARLFVHIRRRIDAGERAYIVCARIDDDADSFDEGYEAASVSPEADLDGNGMPDDEQAAPPLHSVAEMSARLMALPQFRGIEFATLSGRDDDATKRDVMDRFARGDVQVLVSTTVIEVGVDVPQASNIVIFDAERYGLSQLHQLRGRVGRGGTKSWAFFITRAQEGSLGMQRLDVVRSSTDGAQIAQADLELRGVGDVLGDVQSGRKSSLKLLRVVDDADVIEQARADAEDVLAADPTVSGNVALAGAVFDFMRSTEAAAN